MKCSLRSIYDMYNDGIGYKSRDWAVFMLRMMELIR